MIIYCRFVHAVMTTNNKDTDFNSSSGLHEMGCFDHGGYCK